jgi:hypothetical protein
MAKKATTKQAPEVKKAQKVLSIAVAKTKSELKSKEIKKVKITYPKGLYKATLLKNFEKAAKDASLKLRSRSARARD